MEKLPAAAGDVANTYPEVWKAYSALGKSASDAGPLDGRARRALAEGLTRDEVKHAALLAITTLGFPRAIAALSWIEDITDPA